MRAGLIAALRPRPGDAADYAFRTALCELGRRVEFLDAQIDRLDELIVPLVTARAPALLSLYGVGPDTAVLPLIAAGDHPGRLRSEAAWAQMCAVAPIPAASGKTQRHRLARPESRSQPRPGADRDQLSERPPGHPRLCRAAHRGRTVEEGDHPLSEAVRRPRGLPLPAARQLTPRGSPGRLGPLIGCRRRAGLRTIRRPPRDPFHALLTS